MSLLVWLPLNNGLENQGLSPAKFSVVNSSGGLASSSTGGKTSAGMYKRTAETADHITSDRDFNLNGDFSMCCWVKPTKISTDRIANGIITNHGHLTGGSGITLRYISDTDYRMSINTGVNDSDRTYQTYYGTTNIYNQWHHLCVTYERATQRYRLYVDGKKETIEGYGDYITYGDNAQPRPFCLFAWSTDHLNYGSYRPLCELNDVRLYDHCLSIKEIKEISKGLVAHYQLKGMGSTNYLRGAGRYTKKSPLTRRASDVSSQMNDSYIYYTNDITATIPSDGTYTFVFESDGTPSAHVTSGTVGSSRLLGMWLQNTSTGNHYFWSNYGIGPDGRRYGSVTVPAGSYVLRTNLYAADRNDYMVKMWNIKLVAGSYDPSDKYYPHVDDLLWATLGFDNRREPDCSGNGNHGYKSDDTIRIYSGAPRYGSAYHFNSTNYIACGKGPKVRDEITVSCWGYMDNWSEYSGRRLISCTESGGWNLEPSGDNAANGMCFAVGVGTTSNSYLTAVSDIKIANLSSGWHLFTGTYDGYTAKIYIDGVLRGSHSTSNSSKTPIFYNPTNGIFIAAEAGSHDVSPGGGYFLGRISDCRIYGTALSAEDISDLYKIPVSIGKNGTVFAYDFQEDKRDCIEKTGVVASGSFNDKKVPTYDMKLKTLDDNSCWARIHYLDLTNDTTCFQSAAEVDRCLDKNNRYSRMKDLFKYKTDTGYELMLEYPTVKSTLPAGYTELEYVQTTGNQLIRTGVYGYADNGVVRGHRWELDMQFEVNGVRQLMGYGPYGYEYWGIGADGYYEGMNKQAGSRHAMVHDYSGGTAGGNTLWVDHVSRDVGANLDTSYEYTLFGLKWGENTGYFTYTKFYRGRCVQGTSLIRDFVPARRNSDGAIGLYDLVNGGFYTQYTGSALVAGPAKNTLSFHNRWVQTDFHNVLATGDSIGFRPIATAWPAHSGPLKVADSADTRYDCDNKGTGNWYAPVGQYNIWSGGIPAATGDAVLQTELWVRIDRFSQENQVNIYNNSMTATDYVEI